MTFTQLLENPRFRPAFIGLAVFGVVFLAFNVLVIGGSDIYQLANNIIPVVVAGLASYQLFRIWRGHAQDPSARRVWNYLLAGLLLWSAGDLVWAFYALVLQIDVPYPSWADAVWVSGYFLIFIGLYAQFRTYNVRPTAATWRNIAIFAAALLALTGYFVLLPILQSFDSERLLESFLNVFYPLLDLVLLPLCFLILGTLGGGRLAIAWRIITLGFMLRAVSDLVFARITWDGSYMPGGQINLISSLYDFIYAMSYLTIALGFVAYRVLVAQSTVVEAPAVAAPETPSGNSILVSTDTYNCVISFSDNFLALLNRADAKGIKGASLYQLLGMDEDDIRAFETGLTQQGMIDALPLDVKHKNGAATQVRLSALAVYYEGNAYKGANIVIHTLASLGVQDNLSVESQGMLRAILARTGNPQRETRAALITYFNTQMRMLDDLVHQYGGKTISQTMRMVINDTATKNGWQVRKDGADFVIVDQGDIDTLAGTMSVLLAAARRYARDMVGTQLVKVEVENINTLMNPAVMNQVDHYGLRLSGDVP